MAKSLEEMKADRAARLRNADIASSQNGAHATHEPAAAREPTEPLPEERDARAIVPARSERSTWSNLATNLRAPPHSIESEAAVLGCMIQGPAAAIPIVSDRLATSYFYLSAHQIIFGCLIEFFNRNGAEGYRGSLDLVTLEQYFKDMGHLDTIGGSPILRGLFAEAAGPETLLYHVDILTNKFLRRDFIQSETDLSRRAHEDTEDVTALIEQARARVEYLSSLSGPRKSPLTARTLSELTAMTFDDTDNYFGDRVLAAGQPCTFLGPGGVGKSRLSLQLAVCMIIGRPFLDMATHSPDTTWLFIQTENSNRRLAFDLKNMVTALNLTDDETARVNAHLFIHTLETEADSFLTLTNQQNYAATQALIGDIRPKFINWDPLNGFTDADMNSDMDMRALVSALGSLTRAGDPTRVPLILHHSLTGKAGAARSVGWDKSSYGRNSKVLQAWTRAQINLSPRSPDDPNLLVMSCGKNNNGALFPEIGVEFDPNKGVYFKDDSFDPDEFREQVGLGSGKKKHVSPEEVAREVDDGIPSARLAERLIQRFEVSRATAYRVIEKARKSGKIREEKADNFKPIYFKETPKRPSYDPD